MVHAIRIHKTGGPEVLTWEEVEVGKPGDFDRPQTPEEALDRLEQRAGPAARAMLEAFLRRVAVAEKAYIEQKGDE